MGGCLCPGGYTYCSVHSLQATTLGTTINDCPLAFQGIKSPEEPLRKEAADSPPPPPPLPDHGLGCATAPSTLNKVKKAPPPPPHKQKVEKLPTPQEFSRGLIRPRRGTRSRDSCCTPLNPLKSYGVPRNNSEKGRNYCPPAPSSP